MTENPKVSIDQLLFKNLYYRYRIFLTPLVTIIVCILLFWLVVTPQIQSWFAMRDEIGVDTQALDVMHQNVSIITKLNDATLTQTLATATSALPAEKDFAGILTSLEDAAAVAGTSLGDYSFQLGDLSGLDQQGKAAQLPVQLNVVIKGDVGVAQRFIAQLKKQLPLSDTIGIAVSQNNTITLTVVFYYQKIPKIVFKDNVPLPVLSGTDQQLLQKLFSDSQLGTVTLASPAASPTPSVAVSPTPTVLPTPLVPSPSATPSAQ